MNSGPLRSTAFSFMVCFALTVWAQAASAAACTLTADDLAALQLSSSRLPSQAEFDEKPLNLQTMICATRLHWNRLKSGTLEDSDLDGISPYYLSPLERQVYGMLLDARAQAILSHMSTAEWHQLQQRILGAPKK